MRDYLGGFNYNGKVYPRGVQHYSLSQASGLHKKEKSAFWLEMLCDQPPTLILTMIKGALAVSWNKCCLKLSCEEKEEEEEEVEKGEEEGRKKVYAYVFACACVYTSAVSQGGQKRVSGHQMLELQMVVS